MGRVQKVKISNVIHHSQNPIEQYLTENLKAWTFSASYVSYCYSQQLVTGSDPEPQESISFLHTLFLNTGSDYTKVQVVTRRPLISEAQVRFQVITCAICGGQSGTGVCSYQVFQFFCVSIILPMFHTHIQIVNHRRYIILSNESIVK